MNENCCSNVEKALCKIKEAEKYKPSCQIVNNIVGLNQFFTAVTNNVTIGGSGDIVFTDVTSQNGSLITFTAPSSNILLEENHTYLISVSASGTTAALEVLSLNAFVNGNEALAVPLVSSNVVAGYNVGFGSFYLTTTNDTLLNITNLSAEDITGAVVTINILVIK